MKILFTMERLKQLINYYGKDCLVVKVIYLEELYGHKRYEHGTAASAPERN